MGSFEITKTHDGKYRFSLVAGNGQVLASSILYTSKRSVISAIESMRKYAPEARIDDLS